jgi:CheY-like chemotaxis protein
MKNQLICIVDDDHVYQYAIGRQIELCLPQQKIIKFYHAEEALDYFNQNKSVPEMLPDVMFIDINMPMIDGWQFMEEYEKLIPMLSKTTTCYILSSSIDPRDQQRAHHIKSISRFISKPIEDEHLIEILNKTTTLQG